MRKRAANVKSIGYSDMLSSGVKKLYVGFSKFLYVFVVGSADVPYYL